MQLGKALSFILQPLRSLYDSTIFADVDRAQSTPIPKEETKRGRKPRVQARSAPTMFVEHDGASSLEMADSLTTSELEEAFIAMGLDNSNLDSWPSASVQDINEVDITDSLMATSRLQLRPPEEYALQQDLELTNPASATMNNNEYPKMSVMYVPDKLPPPKLKLPPPPICPPNPHLAHNAHASSSISPSRADARAKGKPNPGSNVLRVEKSTSSSSNESFVVLDRTTSVVSRFGPSTYTASFSVATGRKVEPQRYGEGVEESGIFQRVLSAEENERKKELLKAWKGKTDREERGRLGGRSLPKERTGVRAEDGSDIGNKIDYKSSTSEKTSNRENEDLEIRNRGREQYRSRAASDPQHVIKSETRHKDQNAPAKARTKEEKEDNKINEGLEQMWGMQPTLQGMEFGVEQRSVHEVTGRRKDEENTDVCAGSKPKRLRRVTVSIPGGGKKEEDVPGVPRQGNVSKLSSDKEPTDTFLPRRRLSSMSKWTSGDEDDELPFLPKKYW